LSNSEPQDAIVHKKTPLRNIIYYIIILSFLAGSCTSTPDTNQKFNPDSLYRQAMFKVRHNEDSALMILDKVTEIDSNHLGAHFEKFEIYNARKDYKNAIYELKKYVEQKSDNAEAILCLGMLYDKTNQIDKANEQYRLAIKLFDERLKVPKQDTLNDLIDRAVTIILLGDEKEGKKILKDLLSVYPEFRRLQICQDYNRERLLNEIMIPEYIFQRTIIVKARLTPAQHKALLHSPPCSSFLINYYSGVIVFWVFPGTTEFVL